MNCTLFLCRLEVVFGCLLLFTGTFTEAAVTAALTEADILSPDVIASVGEVAADTLLLYDPDPRVEGRVFGCPASEGSNVLSSPVVSSSLNLRLLMVLLGRWLTSKSALLIAL